jgi:hypothetical protein
MINRFSILEILLFKSVISFYLFLSFLHCFFNQVLGSTLGDTAGGSAADQQVQHLSHFYPCQSFLLFSISVIFKLFFYQVVGSIVGDTASCSTAD